MVRFEVEWREAALTYLSVRGIMYKVEMPGSIDIAVPDYRVDDSYPWAVPLQTQLFRGVELNRALEVTYDRNDPGQRLTVRSAGCSTGAEADSVMALHNSSGFGGQLEVVGYDIHPSAIRHAGRARHYIRSLVDPLQKTGFRDIESILTRYGFDVDFDVTLSLPAEFRQVSPESKGEAEAKYCEIDSTAVRAPHIVSFEERDLGERPPPAGAAQLILVNNVLYHLHPDEATLIIRNLTVGLSDNGVISIGGLRNEASRRMGTPNNYSETTYKSWLDDTVAQLKDEFCVELQ